MSKAILVIDMPNSCSDCKMLYRKRNNKREVFRCQILKSNIKVDKIDNRCPLKPMPEMKEVRKVKYFTDVVNFQTTYDYITNRIDGQVSYDIDRIFAEGYNTCLKDIRR